jgi:hypothetical protein
MPATCISIATRAGIRCATRRFTTRRNWSTGKGASSLPQGTPVEWTAEETWFFKLSKYQQPLLDFYAQPDFIRPESRRNEVMRFVEGGLSDLSVSRTSFDWGVPVPGSPGHVMYVWVDALTNYLTGAGYPDDLSDMARYWPADHPPDRQGYRAISCGLLAGLPDVCEVSAAASRCSGTASCSTAARRCRNRSAMSSTRWRWRTVRGRRAALFPAARSELRPGRELFGRSDRDALPMPICRTASAISPSAALSIIAKNCDGKVARQARRGKRRRPC